MSKNTTVDNMMILVLYLHRNLRWNQDAAIKVLKEARAFWKSTDYQPSLEDWKRLLEEYCGLKIPASIS